MHNPGTLVKERKELEYKICSCQQAPGAAVQLFICDFTISVKTIYYYKIQTKRLKRVDVIFLTESLFFLRFLETDFVLPSSPHFFVGCMKKFPGFSGSTDFAFPNLCYK